MTLKKTLFLFSFFFAVFFGAIIFDVLVVSPVHELGHLVVGYGLGLEPTQINWGETTFNNLANYQMNLIGFGGGFFAAILLIILFYLVNHFSIHSMESQKKYSMSRIIVLLFESVILTDILVQLSAGITEGISPTSYTILRDPLILTGLLLSFTLLSVYLIFKVKMIKS